MRVFKASLKSVDANTEKKNKGEEWIRHENTLVVNHAERKHSTNQISDNTESNETTVNMFVGKCQDSINQDDCESKQYTFQTSDDLYDTNHGLLRPDNEQRDP